MKTLSVRLDEDEFEVLDKIVQKNKYKNRSQAVRKCIKVYEEKSYFEELFYEINSKLNKLNHNQFLMKNLQEQFFVNMQFDENLNKKEDKCFCEYMARNNPYSNGIMD